MNDNVFVPKKSKAPYLLGILCLIPLIGAFVGLGLLLYALIHYKDKWLAMIGAFGIVFTIVIYFFIYFIGFKSNFGRRGLAQASQVQLDMLIKHVEFYKLEYGRYPNSLQELQLVDRFAPVVDVLTNKTHRKKNQTVNYFNYEKTGDRYLLFSSGLDDLPNTADDLYPQFVKTDSTKIGWIRTK